MFIIFKNNQEIKLMPINCYSFILQNAMFEKGIDTYQEFEALLKKKGFSIDERRIGEYCKAIVCPAFEKAKIMLEALDCHISEKELIESLKLNKEYTRNQKRKFKIKDDQEINITMRLRYSKLIPNVPPGRAGIIFEKRIKSLQNGKINYTKYIHALISKDLTDFILSEENFVEKEGEENE